MRFFTVLLGSFLCVAQLHAATMTFPAAVATPVEVGSIPRGAQRVPMLEVAITVPCDAPASLTYFTLQHRGLGATTDIERVYVMNAERQRVSRAVPVTSQNDVIVPLREQSLAACEKKTYTVFADFSETAEVAGEHQLMLKSIGLPNNARVTITSTPVKSITRIAPQGSVSSIEVEYRDLLIPIVYGKNKIVARVELQAKGQKDQEIRAITFKNLNSASSPRMQNLFLQTADGKRLSPSVLELDDSTVRLVLNPPLKLESNSRKLIELHSDIRGSKKRTIRFVIEEHSDIEATEVRGR